MRIILSRPCLRVVMMMMIVLIPDLKGQEKGRRNLIKQCDFRNHSNIFFVYEKNSRQLP